MWTGVSNKKTAEYITSILTGCANAQLNWSLLESEMQIILQTRLLVGASSFDGRQLSNNLHSLQKMGVNWNSDLFVDLQNEMFNSLHNVFKLFNAQERSMCIYSLGSLGLVFSECDSKTQKVIGDISKSVFNSKISEHVGQSQHFAQHQSNTFIGLTLMGLKRCNMGPTMIQAINHSLQYNLGGFGNTQQVPNTIHS
jgi:hypothetical protein